MKILDVLGCAPKKSSYGIQDVFLVVNIDYDKINLVSLTSGCIVFEESFKTIAELERYINYHYEIEKIGTLIVNK